MRNLAFSVIIAALSSFLLSCSDASKNSEYSKIRIITSLATDWQFTMGDAEPTRWDSVEIPHTPKFEPLVVNNQWQGTMWYRKVLTVKNKNKKYFLNFGGIMHEADLWVNNKFVAKHMGGYLPFTIDITSYLKFNAENEVKLKVNNEDNSQIPPGKALNVLDFNYYGGIYRDVALIETQRIYITDAVEAAKTASGGVLVHFNEVTTTNALGQVKVHVRNEDAVESLLFCKVKLISPEGVIHTFNSAKITVQSGIDNEFVIPIEIANPELWSVKSPNLYSMEIALFSGEKLVDDVSLNVGIRSIKLAIDGFYLNGEKTFINGTNRHQEYPYVGYALSKNANWRDAVKIKQAGFDFVRLSHYPHSESFLDACDALGLLVMNAIPGWQFIGDSVFIENSYQNIRDMVRRDRNHPSVVFWEASLNESEMTEAYMLEANRILKEELPFDDTYSAGWVDHSSYDLFIPARQHAKPPHYWSNYKTNERPLFIAEYGDWEYYAQNAGFNQTEFKNLNEEERTSRQLRAAGEKRLLQQAMNFQEATNSNLKGINTIGHANWLMFDYNRGYANDIESSGISDIFRIPKFAFYFYQSQREANDTLALNEGTGAMVKIATYWTPDSDKNIRFYSNCEEVALYLNVSLIAKNQATRDAYYDRL
jgi:beta-galactosidase